MQISVLAQDLSLDDAYHSLESAVAARIQCNREPLFTTDAKPDALWSRYLASFPVESQAFYTCKSCRHFIERFGGLVTLDEQGIATPFLWSSLDVPDAVRPIADSLAELVSRSRVNGAFRWSAEAWGVASNVSAKTGATWTHLNGTPGIHHERRSDTPFQQIAALREDVGILSRSLDDFSIQAVEEAVRVLQSGALTRSEKAEGIATWFLALHRAIAANPKARRNLVWRAVASAPPGFAHVHTTVVSTLLEDIVAGLAFEEVSRRWSEKLHPLQYQRPTAAPRSGQIEAAERRVREMGLEPSFARRFATLADVQVKLWEPREEVVVPPVVGGMFDVLRQDAKVKPLDLPALPMTWDKFSRTVLPNTIALDVMVNARGNFYGLVTATNADAPPIIQWDGLADHPRNPVNWYVYHHGSMASRWGLTTGWAKVAAVFLPPFTWQAPEKFAHQGQQVFFAIPAAKESGDSGLALFPEILRADLREIRSVIEAYSNRMQITGREDGNANGLSFNANSVVQVRAKTASGFAVYTIDRWE